MIIEKLIDMFKSAVIALLGLLPDIPEIKPPAAFSDGLNSVFGFIGWLMPYEYYAPLIAFILALTAFRIVYNIILVVKR